ncbi:MAG: hypothetical protein K0S30_1193 [Clostridia bacterium]|nr:hypothetical protein [Clostridia bacterium]
MIPLINISEHLEEKIRSIPAKPGVYQMKDAKGNIIYIGKSKTLRTRVRSYFVADHKWEKIKRMVGHIQDIEIIVTDTHLEAQLLECELIKRIKPMYNAQFKNDQKYKYLRIEENCRNKLISIVDEKDGENCFGPYKSRQILLDLIKFFENIYPLSKIDDTYSFTYHILPLPITPEAFEENKRCLFEILINREEMQLFLNEMACKMRRAAEDFRFETASMYRDIMGHIKYLHYAHIKKASVLTTQKILMGEKLEDGYKIFYISHGTIIFKKKYKRLSTESVKKFLNQSVRAEQIGIPIKNGKSHLDFEAIIYTELQDQKLKIIWVLDDSNRTELEAFINRLRTL